MGIPKLNFEPLNPKPPTPTPEPQPKLQNSKPANRKLEGFKSPSTYNDDDDDGGGEDHPLTTRVWKAAMEVVLESLEPHNAGPKAVHQGSLVLLSRNVDGFLT